MPLSAPHTDRNGNTSDSSLDVSPLLVFAERLIAEARKPEDQRDLFASGLYGPGGLCTENTFHAAISFLRGSLFEKASGCEIEFAISVLKQEMEAGGVDGCAESADSFLSRFQSTIDRCLSTELSFNSMFNFAYWMIAAEDRLRESVPAGCHFRTAVDEAGRFLAGYGNHPWMDDYREGRRLYWRYYCRYLDDEFAVATGNTAPASNPVIEEARKLFAADPDGWVQWVRLELEQRDGEHKRADLESPFNAAGGAVLALRRTVASGGSREEILERVNEIKRSLYGILYYNRNLEKDWTSPVYEAVNFLSRVVESYRDDCLELVPPFVSIISDRFLRLRAACLGGGDPYIKYTSLFDSFKDNWIPYPYDRWTWRWERRTPEQKEADAAVYTSVVQKVLTVEREERLLAAHEASVIQTIELAGADIDPGLHSVLVEMQEGRRYKGRGGGLRQPYSSEELRRFTNSPQSLTLMLLRDWETLGYITLVFGEKGIPGYLRDYLQKQRDEGRLRRDEKCCYLALWVTDPVARGVCSEEGKNSLRELSAAALRAVQHNHFDWTYAWCWNGNESAVAFESIGAEILKDVMYVDDEGNLMEARMIRMKMIPSQLSRLYPIDRVSAREYLAETRESRETVKSYIQARPC